MYLDQLGKYSTEPDYDCMSFVLDCIVNSYHPITTPRNGDIVAFKNFEEEEYIHVGLYHNNSLVHYTPKYGVAMSPMAYFQFPIIDFYREDK